MIDDQVALPVLVGEGPSRTGDRYHHFPLSGRPARVLCTLAGISPQDEGSTYGRWTWALYERFVCVNVFERYAQATPWSVQRARERAFEINASGEVLSSRVVVCLGRRVAAAFGIDDIPFYHWAPVESDGISFVSIPHPSGLNRVLNDLDQRVRAGEVLREAMVLAAGVRS